MSNKTVSLTSLKLAPYYAPATSMLSATGAVVAVIFMTLLIFTLYLAYTVYHKNVTHFDNEKQEDKKLAEDVSQAHNIKNDKLAINNNDEESQAQSVSEDSSNREKSSGQSNNNHASKKKSHPTKMRGGKFASQMRREQQIEQENLTPNRLAANNIKSIVKNLAKSTMKSATKSPAKRAGVQIDHQEIDFEIVSCSSEQDSIPTPTGKNESGGINSSQILASRSSTNKRQTPLKNKQPAKIIETPNNDAQSELADTSRPTDFIEQRSALQPIYKPTNPSHIGQQQSYKQKNEQQQQQQQSEYEYEDYYDEEGESQQEDDSSKAGQQEFQGKQATTGANKKLENSRSSITSNQKKEIFNYSSTASVHQEKGGKSKKSHQRQGSITTSIPQRSAAVIY